MLHPRAQREHEEREAAQREPARESAPAEAFLDPGPQPGRERERQERGRQREPRVVDDAPHEPERAEGREQQRDPAEQLVDRLRRELPQAEETERGAGEDEARRVELEFGVAAPPVGVPVGGPVAPGEAALERMPEPEELAGMIVERRNAAAERGEAEGAAVRQEEEEWRQALLSGQTARANAGNCKKSKA